MNDVIVIFSADSARIVKGAQARDFAGKTNIVINPDLSQVKGLPPHAWKFENGSVVSHTPQEIARREQVLAADSSTRIQMPTEEKIFFWGYFLMGAAAGMLLATLFIFVK